MRHAFEVTRTVARTRANTCSRSRSRARRSATAAPSARSPAATGSRRCSIRSLNPGGIWRPVRARVVRPGAHRPRARVLCIDASVERGRLACDVTLDAGDEPREAQLHAVVRGPDDARAARRVADGDARDRNERARVDARPSTTRRAGGRARSVRRRCARSSSTSRSTASSATAFARRVAFRDVRRDGSALLVNGERMFLKGASYAPARALLGDADDELIRADVDRALDANLDLLRVHTHVAPPALYDAADEAGLLLWQDLPMEGGYARGVRKQAARQARAMVELLGHHPSIVMWCAHDAPLGDDAPARARRERDRADVGQGGARPVDRACDRARTTAPGRSSAAPAPATTRTCGSVGDTARSPASRPRCGPCPASAVSCPRSARSRCRDTAEWMHPERWPRLDWDDLAEHHGMERARVRRARPRRRREVVRRVARRDAGVPGRAPAAADRGPPALQGHAVRRVRGVLPRRPGARGRVRPARPRAGPEARLRARCATRAGRSSRWSTRAPATCTS